MPLPLVARHRSRMTRVVSSSSGKERVLEAHGPAAQAVVIAAAEDAAAGRVHQEIGHAAFQEQFGRAVKRVTFADRAEVELHTRLEIPDRFRLGVELDEPAADPFADGFHFTRPGNPAFVTALPPERDERTGRRVERAVQFFRKRHCLLQEGEEAGLDLDRFLRGAGVDSRELAVGAIDRHLVLEPVDERERFGRRLKLFGRTRIEVQLEIAGHRPLAETHPVPGRRERRRLGQHPVRQVRSRLLQGRLERLTGQKRTAAGVGQLFRTRHKLTLLPA